MKSLRRFFYLLLAILVGGSVIVVFLMLENEPMVAYAATIDAQELSQARVFIENSDPRGLEPGEMVAFTVNERDLELLIGYALSQVRGGGARVSLQEGLADVTISARLPDNFLGNYLNVQLTVSQWGDALAVEKLRLGGITIPRTVADRLLRYTHERLQQAPEYVAALDAVNGYSIASNRINLVYHWRPGLVQQVSDRGRELLISAEDRERLIAHASNLAAITNDPRLPREASVVEILAPMMLFAKVRGGDPVAENRAAILALSMYVMGISMPRVLGVPEEMVPPMGRRHLLLSGRHDFAQHFLISAALTVSAGTSIADTIGLLKELDDADGGSGFSFADIGADRTGVRFAEMAIAGVTGARAVQDKLSFGVAESDLMADFHDLPEFMDEATFRQRYTGVGSPAYDAVMDDIESRIANTRLFRELNR